MKTLLLLFLFCSSANALNLGEIRTEVRSLITDGQGTRQRFSDTELNSWVNEGQRIADITTLCTQNTTSFELVSGTTFYDMPSNFLQIDRVTRDYLSIQEMTQGGLDGRSAEWQNQSGLPTYYFSDFATRGKIGFAPFPSTTTECGTIRVDYVSYSVSLSTDTDVPFGGIIEFYPFHYALAYYSAFKASMVDERDNKSKVFMDSFSSLIGLMKTRCKERPNYRPSLIGKSQ